MLSILIPTYNYNCTQLVFDLYQQSTDLSILFEILVADDASTDESKDQNRSINKLPNCRFIELPENIGRSKIRNFLGEQAKYNNLLFMDCDGKIKNKDFIKQYISASQVSDVIIGGLCNPDKLPNKDVSLRYYYEKKNFKRYSTTEREKNPYLKFTTFCFLIKRSTFLNIQFDESITKYGHEDTLFGAKLQEKNIPIKHINNPLCHLGLENNNIYLHKVRVSIEVLLDHKNNLKEHSQLFIFYNKIKTYKIHSLILFVFKMFKPILEKNLSGAHPNMQLFAFYKLGYLCYIDRGNQSNTSGSLRCEKFL